MRLLANAILLLLSSILVLLVFLTLMEERERIAWLEAPSTLHLYTTDEVCQSESKNILNCGPCGACSNRQGILIYKETASSLTFIMTQCAFRGYIQGSDDVTLECLVSASRLTLDCAKCWVLNAVCNKKHCKNACIKHRFLPSCLPSLGVWKDDRLDPCHACDKKFCGPEFVRCAGANRRRVGVVSDIERNM